MENANYEKNQGGELLMQNPPAYSEKEQHPSVDGPAPPMGFGANPAVPQQYRPYYAPYGVAPSQEPNTQLLVHTTYVIPVQPIHEPDHLGYSIFTMLCCCLPLGIAALVYSVQTRDANRVGDGVTARHHSRMALIFAHTALGVGFMLGITYMVYTVLSTIGI